MKTLTSAEAQNNFGQLLDSVQREPVAITRHGRTAAFVVSERDMDEILEARKRRAAASEAFRKWAAEADKHITDEARSLTEEDIVRMVHELR